MTEPDVIEEAIFYTAVSLTDSAARSAFLERVCGGDTERRNRIDELLLADARAREFESPDPSERRTDSTVDSTEVRPSRPLEEAGTRIGRYRLLEKLGEGGMGVVYLAEQQEPVRRLVALKIIKLGMDSRQVVARFEAERQALALMDHPNIAKVLDGGVVGAAESESANRSCPMAPGRPYFVMELVAGEPITEFCAKNRLSVEERLRLFIPVCQAVQHAHQKGIIHRDLKPSNILVGDHDGVAVPKVIDFGVAKAINQPLTEKTLLTRHATLIGTPAYMSPEQADLGPAARGDIDTRSDIYSLGVLLYELLTGTPPFSEDRLRNASYSEMQRILAQETPERPSIRVRMVSAEPVLAGTGGSVSITPHTALAADLDWIVLKCLEKDRNRRYQTANGLAADLERFLANEPVVARPPSVTYRFRKWVQRNTVAAAAATTVLVVLLVGVAVSSWQAVRARKAEREAGAIKDFLLEQLVGAASPLNDSPPDPNKRPALERIASQLEGRFADQPLIEAELRFALGDAYRGMLEFSLAAGQWEKALAIQRGMFGLGDPRTLLTVAALADAEFNSGRIQMADDLLNEADAAMGNPVTRPSVGAGMVWCAKGQLRVASGRFSEALPFLQGALAILQRCSHPADHQIFGALISTIDALYGAGRQREAHELLDNTLERLDQERGDESSTTLMFLQKKADLLLADGEWQQALATLQRYLPRVQRTFGTNSLYALRGEAYRGRASALGGDLREATECFAHLPERLAVFFPDSHARSECHRIAQFYARQGRYEEARFADGLLLKSYLANPPVWHAEYNEFIEAVASTQGWAAAADAVRTNVGPHLETMDTWATKALAACAARDETLRRRVISDLIARTPQLPELGQPHVPLALAALGPMNFSDFERQRLDSWIQSLETRAAGLDRRVQAMSYGAIGQLHLRLGRFDEGRTALDHARELMGDDVAPNVCYSRALCLHRLNQDTAARVAFDEGDNALRRKLPEPIDRIAAFEDFLDPWLVGQELRLREEAAGDLKPGSGGR